MDSANGRVIFADKARQPTSTDVDRTSRAAPLLIGLLLGFCQVGIAQADRDVQVSQPQSKVSTPASLRIIDDFVVVPPIKVSDVAPGRSQAFTADPTLGRVWVLLNYTGQLIDPQRDGVTTFSVVPEGVRVDVLDSISVFQSRFMSKVNPATDLSIPISPGTYLRSIEDTMSRMRPLQREKFIESLGDAFQRRENWRRGLIKREFTVSPTDFGQIIASLQNLENFRVVALQIVVGQGPLPVEIGAMLAERDGSWLYRHRKVAYFVLGVLLLWLLVVRRIVRRPNDFPT